jgi:hypothetical protein
MPKKILPSIHYNFWPSFPIINFHAQVHVSRDEVPTICERLHSFVSSKRGASFYYPLIPSRITACRYEWPRHWGKQSFALRLGFLLIVGDTDLKEIHPYITTNEAMENPNLELPTIPKRLLNRLQQELTDTLTSIFSNPTEESEQPKYPVFYAEMPVVTENQIETTDHKLLIFPTQVVKKNHKRVSAISVKVVAASDEGGKVRALHEVMLLFALLTLATREVFKTIQLPYRRNLPKIKSLESWVGVDLNKLYPINTRPPASWEQGKRFGEKVNYIWESYHKLSEAGRNQFLPALFAYYTGLDIFDKQPTLAIVAFIAALSSLASELKLKCSGDIQCSVCGSLENFGHDIVGDRAAVTALVSRLLRIESPDEKKNLKHLIRRVYSEQRSAYVHGAVLRYEEYNKKSNLPAAFPTASEPVRPLYYYKRDLHLIEKITRQTLLEWVAQQHSEPLNRDLLNLEEIKIEGGKTVEGVLTLPSRRLVHIIPGENNQKPED